MKIEYKDVRKKMRDNIEKAVNGLITVIVVLSKSVMDVAVSIHRPLMARVGPKIWCFYIVAPPLIYFLATRQLMNWAIHLLSALVQLAVIVVVIAIIAMALKGAIFPGGGKKRRR